MSNSESAVVEMTARVQRLERSNQRLFGLVVLLVLAAFVQTAWHYLPNPGPIAATRFVLKQRGGPPRGEFSLWQDGTPAFRINNDRGEARALFTLRRDGTLSLKMTDRRFTTRLEMLVQPDGNPRVALYGEDGHSRANVWIDGDGHGRFDAPAR